MPPTITTERLRLRPFTADDLAAAYLVLEGHPDVWRFDPGFQRTREQRDEIILKYARQNEDDGSGTLAMTSLQTGELLGYVGLQLYVLPREPLATPEVELYYKLGRDAWGQGYAYEACRALARFAFDSMRLTQLVTITDKRNSGSIRLLERLGMRVEPAPPSWPGMNMGTLANDRAE